MRFPVGCAVEVADEAALSDFKTTWKYHHPLEEAQLQYAGLLTTVTAVSFYHGGDVLYQLRHTGPYTWHDACLRIPGRAASAMDELDECYSLDLVSLSERGRGSLCLLIDALGEIEQTDDSPPSIPGDRPSPHVNRHRLFEFVGRRMSPTTYLTRAIRSGSRPRSLKEECSGFTRSHSIWILYDRVRTYLSWRQITSTGASSAKII